jgi:2-methylcitrate dehydratase PrpD
MKSMNLTDKFIDGIYDLSKSTFPDAVVHQAKRCLLDYLGATLAGAKMLEDKGNLLLSFLGNSYDEVSVIGFNRKNSVQNAVLLNGLSAHVAEMDDGCRFGAIHPGSPIISALLPLAEKENISGSKLITGIIVGYEAAIRIAGSMQPSHNDCGYHPTGTCGTIGAAMGIAAMLGFSRAQMKDAFSAAAISASGTLKAIEDGSELKPFNAGKAALNGLFAAMMARAGFKGNDDVLSGKRGFFSLMSNQYDDSWLEIKNGDQFCIEKVYFKPYASCRHTHPAVEATIKIRFQNDIKVSDIKTIKIHTYKGVLSNHGHTDIRGITSAKMSVPYSVAVSLIKGSAGLDSFTEELVNDAEIISLMKKIEIIEDDKISALVPEKRAAIVEFITNNGFVIKERVDLAKGEPETPLSDNEIEEKFTGLAQFAGKNEDRISEIIKCTWNIENDLQNLCKFL